MAIQTSTIANPRVPVVYLDSQDYSRFGDVLRGTARSEIEDLFATLVEIANAGDAIFPISMPLLSELFQYERDFRETTMCKARALQLLCGSWALAFPSRLVAWDVAVLAKELGYLPERQFPTILSNERYWFPNVSGLLDDLRSEIRKKALDKIDSYPANRASRRHAKKRFQKVDMAPIIAAAVPEFASVYGLPEQDVHGSLVALLKNEISPAVASNKLFSSIAHPARFAEIYFEKVEVDTSALPSWMSEFGRRLESGFNQLADASNILLLTEQGQKILEESLSHWPSGMASSVLRMIGDDATEFGLDAVSLESLAETDGFALKVPSAYVVACTLKEYAHQIAGLRGSRSKIERSVGGDLVHAIYLPHVDLWRTDKRFSAVVKRAVPRYENRVIRRLQDVPEAIQKFQNNSL
jgi:hypothetical protein